MTPLKVTFRFASPLARDSDHPIYLDALLAWARVNEAEALKHPDPWPLQSDLPLERAGGGEDWVWQASRLEFEPAGPRQIVSALRKCDPDRFYRDFQQKFWVPSRGNTPPVINTDSGQLRAYQYFYPVQWMEKAEAWCVGDEDRVRLLLNRLHHLGKLGRNGYGLIQSITVEPDPSALTLWRLRTLPSDVEGSPGVAYGAVLAPPRAPYWEKRHRVMLREPIS